MDPTVNVNERVAIVPIFSDDGQERLICVPWKMRFHGQEIIFTVFGMRHPTQKGKRMIHVFDMSDGSTDYRIEFDAERLTWTLLSIIGEHYDQKL